MNYKNGIEASRFKDGGTCKIYYNGKWYWRDNRIGSKTRGLIFEPEDRRYPLFLNKTTEPLTSLILDAYSKTNKINL